MNISLLIFVLVCFKNAIGDHFRGGTIMWKTISINSSVAIVDMIIKLGFRRSFGTITYCDQNTINSNKPIFESFPLNVSPGSLLIPFNGVYCTDFSVSEDWSYGERTFQITYNNPSPTTTYRIVFPGGAWIYLLNQGTSWNLISRVTFNIQNHTNKINQSPITSMSPLIRVPVGCYKEIKIPVVDLDGDVVKCRWSVGEECGNACGLVSSIQLDGNNCVLKLNLPPAIGYYGLRLQIEDFASQSSSVPLSSIPLEFLVQSYTPTSCFSIKPVFEYPTKEDQTCVSIPLGSTYRDTIFVNSKDSSNPVREIQTVSPSGLIKSPLYTFNNTVKYVNITWTPLIQEISIFCFIGITNSFETTDQRCLSLSVGFITPTPIKNTSNPFGFIYSNQTEWSISVNQNLSRPLRESFLRFYLKENNMAVYEVSSNDYIILENTIKFLTKEFLENNETYYIKIDYGFFQSNIGCRLLSEEISNQDFWTFTVKNCKNCNEDHGNCTDIEVCECENNWSGESCDVPVCEKNCNNNGKCIDANVCDCFYGFTGTFCEQRLCLSLNNCSNHGICNEDETCKCENGWTSLDCSKPISEALATGDCDNNCYKFNCLCIILTVIIVIILIILFVIVYIYVIKPKTKISDDNMDMKQMNE